MIRLTIATCLFYLLATATSLAAVGDRHFEQAGGFSLQAPKGWQFREIPGMKYQFAIGPAVNSFSPNINAVDETYPGSLQSYVDANKETLSKLFVQFKLVKREPFVTAKGVQGERMITNSLQQNTLLRQTFYFMPGLNGKHFVLTCSALADGGDALDAVFEESIRTFELIK